MSKSETVSMPDNVLVSAAYQAERIMALYAAGVITYPKAVREINAIWDEAEIEILTENSTKKGQQ